MKFRYVFACLMSMVMVAPVFAAFDLDTTETFDDGFGSWDTSGAVSIVTESSGDKYAKLAEFGTNDDSWISHTIHTDADGYYALNFDYRWEGWDLLSEHNDTISVGVDIVGGELYSFNSDTDLSVSHDWSSVNAPPPSVYLEANEDYEIFFRLQEDTTIGGGWAELGLITTLHLDNIDFDYLGLEQAEGQETKQVVVPAPGALLLGTIGVSLVGFLRRRNAF